MVINTTDFSRLFSKYSDRPIGESLKIVQEVFAFLGEILYEHQMDVSILGFGSFKQSVIKGKTIKHPLTGESIDVPDSLYVKFKPSERARAKAKAKLELIQEIAEEESDGQDDGIQ